MLTKKTRPEQRIDNAAKHFDPPTIYVVEQQRDVTLSSRVPIEYDGEFRIAHRTKAGAEAAMRQRAIEGGMPVGGDPLVHGGYSVRRFANNGCWLVL